jgi:photosystem II stability/assembly factor-like uncharacterized protein
MWSPEDWTQMMVRGSLAIMLVCALGGGASAGVWTDLRPDLVQSHFTDVCFADALRGWTVGSPGYVLHTTDGGATWSDPVWICWGELSGVDFVDSLRGWAVDSPGARIFYTTDGGKQWHEQPNSVTGALKAVDFVDSLHGWAVGWKDFNPLPATVLRTTNGGGTWIDESPGLRCWVEDVCFVDTLWGWVVAQTDTPNLMRSTDGGEDWHRLDPGTTRDLRAVHFLNRDEGWIAGEIDSVFHTTDGGESWDAHHIPQQDGFRDIWFLDSLVGWAVGGTDYLGGRQLFRTADGGVTWSEVEKDNANLLSAVTFSHPRNGVAVGRFSTILHSDDGGQRWSEALEPSNDLYDIARVDVNRAWAVGADGAILRTSDGGETWEWQESGTDVHLAAVSFVDSLTGWAAGGPPPVLLHTQDAGETWVSQSIDAVNALVDVGFVDSQVGWAVETGDPNSPSPPHMFRTTAGGSTWESQELDPSIRWLGGGHFASADTAWVVGEASLPTCEGVVVNTTNAGAEWTICYQEWPWLEAIHAPTPDSIWAVGGGGVIVRSTNGGDDWQITQYPGISDFHDVVFVDSRRGWTVGMGEYTGNVSVHTTDGGASWMPDSVAGQSWEFYSVSFLDAEDGWLCSAWGGVWRYDARVGVEDDEARSDLSRPLETLRLGPCSPNPFRTSTGISFTVPGGGRTASLVKVRVYNILGQLVTSLVEEAMQAGEHVLRWNGTDECGAPTGSGIYVVSLEVGSQVKRAKVVLLR